MTLPPNMYAAHQDHTDVSVDDDMSDASNPSGPETDGMDLASESGNVFSEEHPPSNHHYLHHDSVTTSNSLVTERGSDTVEEGSELLDLDDYPSESFADLLAFVRNWAPVYPLDDLNADVDAAVTQSDVQSSESQASAEVYRDPTQIEGELGAWPSVEYTQVEQWHHAGTVDEIPYTREHEEFNRGPNGLHGYISGPAPVLEPMVIDDPELETSHRNFIQPTGAKLVARKQSMIDSQKGKDFACHGCPRRYKTLNRMRRHYQNGECAKFHCGIGDCEYDYWDSHTVDRHRLTSDKTGDAELDEPFECDQCLRRFTRRDLLMRHVRRAHIQGLSSGPVLDRSLMPAVDEIEQVDGLGDFCTAQDSILSNAPDEWSIIADHIMEEDFDVDRIERNKQRASDMEQPHASHVRARSDIPPILGNPVQPIDDLNDLGYPLLFSCPNGGNSSSGAGLSGRGPSHRPDFNNTINRVPNVPADQARYHQQPLPPLPDVPPRARQRDQGLGNHPRQPDLPPVSPHDANGEMYAEFADEDAEWELDE